jgi:hypothetical protein
MSTMTSIESTYLDLLIAEKERAVQAQFSQFLRNVEYAKSGQESGSTPEVPSAHMASIIMQDAKQLLSATEQVAGLLSLKYALKR